MKPRDIREFTDEELRQKLSDTKDELFKLKIQKSVGEVDKPVRLRTLRRDIARMRTIMKQRG